MTAIKANEFQQFRERRCHHRRSVEQPRIDEIKLKLSMIKDQLKQGSVA
jgi:hypothetical protein